ncbi:MAG: CHASE domain-containing protein [Burkholderiales bacterium]|nr:CHASE domain-containing protein [Burkholderiales bacterium]
MESVVQAQEKNTRGWRQQLPWLLLLSFLCITALAWNYSNRYLEQRAKERFAFRVQSVKEAVERRLLAYEQVLQGGVGLFRASSTVSRQQWREYVENAEIARHFPGIQNMTVSLPVPAAQLAQHIQEMRAQGFPDYKISPALPERPVYHSIIYPEPYIARNLRALGFDMYTNPVRRAAMDRAIDSGLPSMSGMVTLVQETQTDVQHGFLLFLPVYRNEANPQTPEQRRAALRVLVAAAFRMNDLMKGIFGSKESDVDLEIYDEGVHDQAHLMYASHTKLLDTSYSEGAVIDTSGRKWLLQITAKQSFIDSAASPQSSIIAIAGTLISLSLFYIFYSLNNRNRRTHQLAAKMANDLFEKEAQFSGIVASASDAIISMNLHSEVIIWNPAAEQMTGYTQAEMLGRSIRTIVPPERLAESQLITARLARGEIVKNLETVCICKDGSRLDVSMNVSPMHNKNGEHCGSSSVVTNISQRKQMEKIKSQFISTVSHELRTPLTSIRGSLGLVVAGAVGPIPEKAKLLIALAEKNCTRLARLIDDILDVEKLESGNYQFNLKRFDIYPLLIQAMQENQAYAQQCGTRFEMISAVDQVFVQADPDRLLQVISNLFSNAAKFSPENKPVEISLLRQAGLVRVEIRDYGSGIPEEFKSRIFQKFAQADSSDTRKLQIGNTGLGLSIAKDIIEQMGGSIGFISAPDQGTIFYFEIADVSRETDRQPEAGTKQSISQ